MRQRDLFAEFEPAGDGPGWESLGLPDAEVELFGGFWPARYADEACDTLRSDTDWEQESYVMYGRDIPSPRLTAWYGNPGSVYTYSGVTHEALAWTPLLADLRDRVEAATSRSFNSVLLNYYRNGLDSVSWHSDDERDLGPQPAIASLSLGATRTFQFKHRDREDLPRHDVELTAGSLLVMAGDCQRYWKHQIPKRKNLTAGRINLTFRRVRDQSAG